MRGYLLIQDDFDKILLSAVDEGLCLLGNSPKQAILFHLENPFQIKEENIPSNLKQFRRALETIFGPGAAYLENAILKRLHDILGLEFKESKNADFLECIEMAKSRRVKKEETTTE
jgi:hypothetical protein